MSFKAKPRSIKDIREKAELISTVTEMAMDTKTEQFPILHFAEILIPQIAEDFTFVIGSKEEMGNNLGLTDIKEKTITIREDVYENAYNGNGRDLFTIAHEVGHVLLHAEQNIQQLARTNKETRELSKQFRKYFIEQEKKYVKLINDTILSSIEDKYSFPLALTNCFLTNVSTSDRIASAFDISPISAYILALTKGQYISPLTKFHESSIPANFSA